MWRNEIGVNLFSFKFNNLRANFSNYKYAYVSGLYYKGYYGQNVLRFSLDVFQSNVNEFEAGVLSPGIPGNISSYLSTDIRLGYQRDFGFENIVVFACVDAMINRIQTQLSYITNRYGQVVKQYSEFEDIYAGVSLGSGFRLALSKDIGLIYEMGIILLVPDKLSSTMSKSNYAFVSPVRQLGLAFLF
jgi:hypothetical protein